MAAKVGRTFRVLRGDAVIAGVRTRSFTINNGNVDVTDDGSNGFRELLELSGERDISASIEGITKDAQLIEAGVNGNALIQRLDLETYPGIIITGDFRMNNIQIGAEYNDASAFTAEMQGTGFFGFLLTLTDSEDDILQTEDGRDIAVAVNNLI